MIKGRATGQITRLTQGQMGDIANQIIGLRFAKPFVQTVAFIGKLAPIAFVRALLNHPANGIGEIVRITAVNDNFGNGNDAFDFFTTGFKIKGFGQTLPLLPAFDWAGKQLVAGWQIGRVFAELWVL